jgi:hypothetical protein
LRSKPVRNINGGFRFELGHVAEGIEQIADWGYYKRSFVQRLHAADPDVKTRAGCLIR